MNGRAVRLAGSTAILACLLTLFPLAVARADRPGAVADYRGLTAAQR